MNNKFQEVDSDPRKERSDINPCSSTVIQLHIC